MRSISIIILLFPILASSQDFSLTGEFIGDNTEILVLAYTPESGDPVGDTIKIDNGKFEISGDIKGVQRVFIYGNRQTESVHDPNFAYFYLEPGNIKIKLEEDNFKNLKVNGSSSHSEYNLFQKQISPIITKIDSLSNHRTEGSRKILQSEFQKLRRAEINYAVNHPDSPLSPGFLLAYHRDLPLDSVVSVYSEFSDENQKSLYGNVIKDFIRKAIRQENEEVVPDFHVTDISGNDLSLDTYKGKYLLINFWAEWCRPCIAHFPEFKSLISKYENQELEVLFVSFDRTEEDWKRSVKKHNLQDWDHTFVGLENVKSRDALNYIFDVQPIPAYILIGPEGQVLGRYANASNKGQPFEDLFIALNVLLQ